MLADYLALEKGTISFSKRPLHAGDESIKHLVRYAWQEYVTLTSSMWGALGTIAKQRLERRALVEKYHDFY